MEKTWPKRPKKINKYEVAGHPCKSWKDAAARAVELATSSGESVAISELDHDGFLLGYINVQASTEAA
jgi:hypothetical protein